MERFHELHVCHRCGDEPKPESQRWGRRCKAEHRRERRKIESIAEAERARWRERWAKTSPERRFAKTAVYLAVRSGRLVPPAACSRCGDKAKKIEGHHEDYNRPLDVVWLCSVCHKSRHPGVQSAAKVG